MPANYSIINLLSPKFKLNQVLWKELTNLKISVLEKNDFRNFMSNIVKGL